MKIQYVHSSLKKEINYLRPGFSNKKLRETRNSQVFKQGKNIFFPVIVLFFFIP